MADLTGFFSHYIKDICFSEASCLLCLTDREGNIIECNRAFERLRNSSSEKLKDCLVESSFLRLLNIMKGSLKEKEHVKSLFNFINDSDDLPLSYNCWIIKVPDDKFLLYGEAVPPLVQKQAREYVELTNELMSVTRQLQKREFQLGRAQKELKNYADKLEDMVALRTEELKEAQEKLLRKEKLSVLGQMAGTLGHELKNPLGVISNAVYFLNMVLAGTDETVKEHLEMISAEVKRADGIVSDLRNFSRVRSAAEREKLFLSSLVSDVLKREKVPKNIDVNIVIPEDLPPLFVDGRQIGQVLLNLITNAWQAMPDGGKLSIKAEEKDNNCLSISISDRGCGIPEDRLEKIFEPLFTTKTRGIGLGLAICKKLIEVNGGEIKVTSEEGKGSTFILILPSAER